jgi:membrane-associated phospholipid phosphatase
LAMACTCWWRRATAGWFSSSVPRAACPGVFRRTALTDTLSVYVVAAVAALALLSTFAHARAFFAIDPPIEQWIQAVIPAPFGRVLDAVSWVGFPPQVDAVIGLGILFVISLGYRWEAICLAFAGLTGAVSWFGMAVLVDRPRPSPDLVHVERMLGLGSYPSGHVLNLTSFFGSLFILSWLGMRPTWYRGILQILSAVMVVCIGVARIYSGEHWPSDVLAGYLQGSIVVALTCLLYVWRPTIRTADPKGRGRRLGRSGGTPAQPRFR